MTPDEARTSVLRLVRLTAAGATRETIKDRLLVEIVDAHGIEGVGDVAADAVALVAAAFLGVGLHEDATARPVDLVAALDAITAERADS